MKFPKLTRAPFTLIFLLLGGLFILSACSMPPAAPTLAPTIDPATYVAAAVNTLSVRMTEDALRNPTATPVPTETPVPFTPTSPPPTATATPEATATETPTQQPAVSAEFLYASTFPDNKRERVPNEKFGVAFGFKNTGTVTWQPGYRLKIVNFQGEDTVEKEVELSRNVPPGEKIEFDLWAYGSETLGQHVWYFQLYTANGGPVPGGVASYSYTSK